jgi:fructose 1,6-bisphosphate aldolase/phosphatase
MTHRYGNDNPKIHKLAWEIFLKCTEKAKELKLYGAGQDLLKESFSGNLRGMGPGVAEMTIEERKSEPILIFMADKTEPGAWNMPLYKMFADPFNTAGLIIDPTMHEGFTFEVLDVMQDKTVMLKCPKDIYDLLVLIGSPGRYIIKNIWKNKPRMIAATSTTSRLSLIAGRYVGKDDPALIVRAQKGLPAVGEVLEAFAFPQLVEGWMRGSHNGPLMPCSVKDSHPTRFDGPPRVMCLGFQISNGRFGLPRDMFDDPSFDLARSTANYVGDYLRRHGPFQPHRLASDAMEYTTLPKVLAELEPKFKAAEHKRILQKKRRIELEKKVRKKYKLEKR